MRRLVAGISGRRVEIMRGELASILYEAARTDAQYLFEDSIQAIVEEPDSIAVAFEHAPADRCPNRMRVIRHSRGAADPVH
jgi:hypothetical protein